MQYLQRFLERPELVEIELSRINLVRMMV